MIPYLVPSYGDSDFVVDYSAKSWGRMCIYQPGATPTGSDPASTSCGANFSNVSAAPRAQYFREGGNYVQDLDGDGWEDINVVFHSTTLAISSRTGAHLSAFDYDVAASTEPSAPVGFHSGRNYGSHSSFTGKDGLSLRGLKNGLWTDHGSFPVAGRPKLFKAYASSTSRSQGYSQQIPYAELKTADRDGDGLADVQLEGGQWIGFDRATASWVVK